jgi:hypothetical protein
MKNFADLAQLRSLVLVGEMGRLIERASDEPNAGEGQAGSAEPPDGGWQRWRESVEAFVDDVCVEGEARTSLHDRYFEGRQVLFAEILEQWTPVIDQADRLSSMVENLPEPFRARAGFDRPAILPTQPGSIDDRAGRRAVELADEARIAAFESLGERRRAMTRLQRRLRM